MKDSAVTLLSGGLDSAVATLLTQRKLKIALALTFDYGQRAAAREIAAAKAFCTRYKIPHKIIKLPWLFHISHSALTDRKKSIPTRIDKKSAEAVWVPNRNAVFVAIAAAYAEAMGCKWIVAGFNAEEARTFPDNSKKFVKSSNKLFLSSTLSHPKIKSPTQRMTKIQIAREAKRLRLSPRFFWSCYRGGASMCGRCESCIRIIRAFKAIGEPHGIPFHK